MGAIFAIAAVLELPAMTLAGRLLRRQRGTLMFCSGLGLTAKKPGHRRYGHPCGL